MGSPLNPTRVIRSPSVSPFDELEDERFNGLGGAIARSFLDAVGVGDAQRRASSLSHGPLYYRGFLMTSMVVSWRAR